MRIKYALINMSAVLKCIPDIIPRISPIFTQLILSQTYKEGSLMTFYSILHVTWPRS